MPIAEHMGGLYDPLQYGLGSPDVHPLKIFEEGLHLDGHGGNLGLHTPLGGNSGFQVILPGLQT